jgi:dimethylamine/trimethylamine dehydrogenase
VFVGARTPNTALWDALPKDRPLYRIGDGEVPGTIQAAVLSGHRIAREILAGAPSEMNLDRQLIEF